MKVLMVNKFFYIKGGSETYFFALKRLLESKGHTVVEFSMKDEKNFQSAYSDYFVEKVEYNNSKKIGEKLKAGMKIIYSIEAKKKFEELILSTKPDLIHLHIFQHQISPSILDVIKKYQIPTIYTAHDLKMLCLNYKMMHHNQICEKCRLEKFYNCAKNKCVKDSFSKSCINVIEGYYHKYRKSYDNINLIITPSEFYRKKFVEFGVDKQRVVHIANFTDSDIPIVEKSEDSKQYYLYFGRLSEEKGVHTLIEAMKKTKKCFLKIVGTGPIKLEIEETLKRNGVDNIQVLGFKNGKELVNIIGNAKAVILPSEWYENGPYSAIEALQLSRPIIGANIGGIPELINNNGVLFKSGDVNELYNAIMKMETMSNAEYCKMERNSLLLFESTYTAERHYNKLIEHYNSLVLEE